MAVPEAEPEEAAALPSAADAGEPVPEKEAPPCRFEEPVEAAKRPEAIPSALDAVSFTRLRGLTDWAAATSAELGRDRTLRLLEISEMMGYISTPLKSLVEKCLPATGPASVYTQSMARAQLRALKNLAPLLDRKRTADFLMLHIAAQLLFSCSLPDPDTAPADN
jgi:hypothetical protein